MAENKNQLKAYGEDINTGTSDSILSSMFRTMLYDLGVTPARFDKLLDKYIFNAKIPNLKEASSQKGNLKKELMKTSMSWKVFIKALVFLNIRRFKVTFELEHATGNRTIHTKSVLLSNFVNEGEDHDKQDE